MIKDASAEAIGEEAPRSRARPRRRAGKRAGSSFRDRRIVGIDGEGQDTPDGDHIYTYLAAVDEHGVTIAEAHNPRGLSHEECVRMLLSIPEDCLCFGYSFNYDVTMILRELPLADIYYLTHPQLRDALVCKNKQCYSAVADPKTIACPRCGSTDLVSRTQPVTARGRRYDYFNGSLTIRRKKRQIKIWDCFRFFGTSFVEAIKDWQVGSADQHDRIYAMKAKRGSFAEEKPEDVKRYCLEECHLLALMMRKLIVAHELAEIDLKRFDGAGSTASALLRANGVADLRGTKIHDLDPALQHAIASAFAGGRFEDSVVGLVIDPVFGFDISSAYPYAQTFLPCLACGSWRLEKRATPDMIAGASAAVAAFRVRAVSARDRAEIAWCPLPCRDAKGSICYGTNFSGWAWAPELLAALAGWPDLVELTGEAWIYETACDHRPFHYVPNGYRKRCEWGKEGPGKAMKLGLNAGYGKTAQAIGEDPPFQCWPWAGLTTATTRGQILSGIALAKDRWSVLAIATDGIVATEDLPLCFFEGKAWRPVPPRDTGTSDLAKPLGGWERKSSDDRPLDASYPEGMAIIKPGLYWRLQPGSTKDVRARGLGRREAFDAKRKIEDGFLDWGRSPSGTCPTCGEKGYHVHLESRRFFGAKHSILARSRCPACSKSWPGVPEKKCPNCKQIGVLSTKYQQDKAGRPVYGRWAAREIRIGFDPMPKRERDGISREGTSARLRVRDLGGITSQPYDIGAHTTTPEGEAQREQREFMLQQPEYPDDPFEGM